MRELTNLMYADESFWLWPPIADAVQTFRRRRDHSADYERLWRLIHIWESIATTLSNVAVARLIELERADDLLRVRELLYALQWDPIDERLRSTGQGALDGSNDKRIEILNVIRKSDFEERTFLNELKVFLEATGATDDPFDSFGEEVDEFARAWRRVCDVPAVLDRGKTRSLSVFDCLKLMNTFRNRFAHVPFPYDPLNGLVTSLEDMTEKLFSLAPRPHCDVDKKCDDRSSPLTGCFLRKRDHWRGAQVFTNRNDAIDKLEFGFPALSPLERWPAAPFAHVDVSKRSYILTRLLNADAARFEFTRFWAEGDAIITSEDESGLALIPKPTESDYRRLRSTETDTPVEDAKDTATEGEGPDNDEPASPPQPKVAESYHEAVTAIRNQDYDAAIPFLRSDVQRRPHYHNAWLKLGFALREKAGRDHSDPETAAQLLNQAYSALSEATKHRDAGYRATAFYDRSKVCLRLFHINGDPADARKAWCDAQEAAKLESDHKFFTWIDFLEGQLPMSATEESRDAVTA